MLNKQIIADVKSALNQLRTQKWRGIGRAANMLCLAFGEDVTCINYKGESTIRPEYALHVQCNWKIIRDDKITMEFNDFIKPKSGLALDKFDPEVLGDSRFDEVSIQLDSEIKSNPLHVIGFDLENCGELKLHLNNNFFLWVIPDTDSAEQWRFIKFGKDSKHFIITNE